MKEVFTIFVVLLDRAKVFNHQHNKVPFKSNGDRVYGGIQNTSLPPTHPPQKKNGEGIRYSFHIPAVK